MNVIECTSQEEYHAKVVELQMAGKTIGSVYPYWYEGTGERQLKIVPGPVSKAMWKDLTLDQKARVCFEMMGTQKSSPEIKQLTRKYRECLAKDYESMGGHYSHEGKPEDSVIVIEYE